MDFPKLIDLLPAPVGHDEVVEGVVPVVSLFRQSKLLPRFLLTWAARGTGTDCPVSWGSGQLGPPSQTLAFDSHLQISSLQER